MMKFYQELTLLPQEEIQIHFLWSKVFQQIHLGLVEIQDDQGRVPVGVSFPDYVVGEKYSVLGGRCRLFAQDEATLIRLDAAKCLARLSDYVHCTSILPVPEKLKGHAIYCRESPKTNKERLARRYAKRHGIDFETALNCPIELTGQAMANANYKRVFRYCEMPQKPIPSPFIRMKSLSSDKSFCLWIKKTMALERLGGTYSSYGLSATATVPEF